ncbi:MAG TPA: hypothetical protein VGK99_22195 [Acidobacteriota bacterium]|jgi:hypothetical protein
MKIRPWFFFSVTFDLRDIRSRVCETLDRGFQAEMIDLEDDLIWTPDMVIERQSDFLNTAGEQIEPPDNFNSAPIESRAENKFMEYLLRYHKISVHRNTVYELYATAQEQLDDFKIRCREMAREAMNDDFRSLLDRYLRRLVQLEDSMRRAVDDVNSDAETTARQHFELNRIFLELKEDLSSLFLEPELDDRGPRQVECDPLLQILDLKEKVDTFQSDLKSDLRKLKQSFSHRADSIEFFQLPLTLNQVRLFNTAILWQ